MDYLEWTSFDFDIKGLRWKALVIQRVKEAPARPTIRYPGYYSLDQEARGVLAEEEATVVLTHQHWMCV